MFTYLQHPAKKQIRVHVSVSTSPASIVCRCGTRIPAGGRVIKVEGLTEPAADLFSSQGFDSVKCLRAFALESMEQLDAMDTPRARAIVSDLHEIYRGIAAAFAQILSET
jgi:hypothetical protein